MENSSLKDCREEFKPWTILTFNLHYSKDASAVLQRSITVMHTGISLIQELCINKDTNRGLRGLGSCYRYSEVPNPKLCIPVKGVLLVEVRSLVAYCKGKGLPLLLGSDSKSHYKLWGSTDITSRCKDVVDYLFTANLDILNTSSTPIFWNSVREQVIDITCTGSIFRALHGPEIRKKLHSKG